MNEKMLSGILIGGTIGVLFTAAITTNDQYSTPKKTYANDWQNPKAPFSTDANFTDQVNLTWLVADKPINEACADLSRQYGVEPLKYKANACALWWKNQNRCIIMTKKNPNMMSLAHEIRHCFQGHFHSRNL